MKRRGGYQDQLGKAAETDRCLQARLGREYIGTVQNSCGSAGLLSPCSWWTTRSSRTCASTRCRRSWRHQNQARQSRNRTRRRGDADEELRRRRRRVCRAVCRCGRRRLEARRAPRPPCARPKATCFALRTSSAASAALAPPCTLLGHAAPLTARAKDRLAARVT